MLVLPICVFRSIDRSSSFVLFHQSTIISPKHVFDMFAHVSRCRSGHVIMFHVVAAVMLSIRRS